jgi:hypothetical protein
MVRRGLTLAGQGLTSRYVDVLAQGSLAANLSACVEETAKKHWRGFSAGVKLDRTMKGPADQTKFGMAVQAKLD